MSQTMTPTPTGNVRVRAKANCQIITSREQGTGKAVRPLPGQWFSVPARELLNKAIAAQVETEEQAAASDAAMAAAAASPAGEPREDPEFMRARKAFRTQAENARAEAQAVAAKRAEELTGGSSTSAAAEPPKAPAAPPARAEDPKAKRPSGKKSEK